MRNIKKGTQKICLRPAISEKKPCYLCRISNLFDAIDLALKIDQCALNGYCKKFPVNILKSHS